MIKNEMAKAYRGNYIPGVGFPFALVGAGQRDHQGLGEYHLAVGVEDSSLYSQCIRITSSHSVEPVDSEFILGFALHVAEGKLNEHLYEYNQLHPQAGFWDRTYRLEEIPLKEIIYFQLQAEYAPQVGRMAAHAYLPALASLVRQISGAYEARFTKAEG
jgi:hypothetical protein